MKTNEEADRELLRQRVEFEIGTPDFEIVASTEILWSGWEGDQDAVLIRRGDGTPQLLVLSPVNLDPGNLVETLREKLAEYEKAYEDTARLLELAAKEGLA